MRGAVENWNKEYIDAEQEAEHKQKSINLNKDDMKGVNLFKRLKYFWQRGRRGYSDYDVLDLHDYLSCVIIDSLFTFMEKNNSVPIEIYTKGKSEEQAVEEWDSIIYDIIQAFAVAEDYEPYQEMSKEDKKTFDKGFALFKKWYFHLWI